MNVALTLPGATAAGDAPAASSALTACIPKLHPMQPHLEGLSASAQSATVAAAGPWLHHLPTSTAPLPAAHSSGVPASLAASTSAPALVNASTTAAFPTAAHHTTHSPTNLCACMSQAGCTLRLPTSGRCPALSIIFAADLKRRLGAGARRRRARLNSGPPPPPAAARPCPAARRPPPGPAPSPLQRRQREACRPAPENLFTAVCIATASGMLLCA
jgi:hypothetical protein